MFNIMLFSALCPHITEIWSAQNNFFAKTFPSPHCIISVNKLAHKALPTPINTRPAATFKRNTHANVSIIFHAMFQIRYGKQLF